MDRKASKSTTAWAVAGGAAVGAVALYLITQYYKKDSKRKPREVEMSSVPDKPDSGDKGAADEDLIEAAQHSRVDSTAKRAAPASAPGSKLQEPSPAAGTGPSEAGAPATSMKAAGSLACDSSGAAAPVAWRQTGGEVTLEAACPKELSRKDVVCLFTTHSVHLEAAGRIIADGQLFAPITPDECCWEFGHDAKTGGGSVSKRLIVDLVKAPLPQSRCLWKTLYAAGDEARAVYVH